MLLQKLSCFLFAFKTFDISQGSEVRGVVGFLVIVLLQNFFSFWQWNNFVNWLIFDKFKAYKNCANSFGTPSTHWCWFGVQPAVTRHHNRPVPSPPQSQPVVSPLVDDDLYEVTDQVSHHGWLHSVLLLNACLTLHVHHIINLCSNEKKSYQHNKLDDFLFHRLMQNPGPPLLATVGYCLSEKCLILKWVFQVC